MFTSQKAQSLQLVEAYGRDSVCRNGPKNSGDLENYANEVDYALAAFASSSSGLYAGRELASGDIGRYMAQTCVQTLIL